MIDTHCHVNFEDYDGDRDEVVERAKAKLNGFIDSGFGYESNIKSLKQSKEYEGFAYSTFGFHPVSSQNCTQKELDDVTEQVITHMDEIVAIGEVGMDYYYCTDKTLRERQKEIFLEFVNIANEYRKPLVIHGRDAEKKIFNILEDYDDIPRVVFHCYGGSSKLARRIADKDEYYMSCSTQVCYSKAHQELFSKIPLERILTETDSPYLAMTKEERNEPANVALAVEKLAEIQNTDVSIIDETTEANAHHVFGI